MSEAETPSPPPPPADPPPPAEPPPPAAPPPAAGGSDNRGLMIALAYLGPLALVPLLVEKDDAEVQWHAKHGLVLLIFWIAISIVLGIITSIPGIGCLTIFAYPVIGLAALIIHILCIVKGVNGERFIVPGITPFADRF